MVRADVLGDFVKSMEPADFRPMYSCQAMAWRNPLWPFLSFIGQPLRVDRVDRDGIKAQRAIPG